MTRHRNPRPRLPKRPSPDNFDPGILIARLYDDLVEIEGLAVTADEACTPRPPRPPGKYGRILARLYALVGKTSGRAQGALERGEELVALHAAHERPGSPSSPRCAGRADLDAGLAGSATFWPPADRRLDDPVRVARAKGSISLAERAALSARERSRDVWRMVNFHRLLRERRGS
jgi:hypothetical protein